ncbi:unnamed protein product [Adineta steineri]|uniref:Ninjurin-2 n=1 Tax=Adineta steineri TaxID=433720 RepID=A0A815M3Y3_9BILA|nr:unnamed protein product [Adineta steineri]CAF1415257.1 unnamed protein product [Adineta steineri]
MTKDGMSVEETSNPPNSLDSGTTTVNQYATKKTLAVGNLEIALIATNAIQLKTLLGNTSNKDTLWLVGLILVCASLIIQIFNACILVLLGTDDISKKGHQHRLVSLNNFSLMLSVLVTIINVVLNIIVAIEPQILNQTLNGTKNFH